MGLDMYLTACVYISRHSEEYKDLGDELSGRLVPEGLMLVGDKYDNIRVHEVRISAAYWRKANQIHKWFVDNCQGGTDDCRSSWVSREQLKELLETCKEIQADHEKAPELLPVQEGFFFGSTEYDDDYFADIDYTVDRLTILLEAKGIDTWEFYYHSSW